MLLTSRQRSQLFSKLATLEHAGIAPAQAFAVVGRDLPGAARQALAQTAADLAKGAEAVEKNVVILDVKIDLTPGVHRGGTI